METEKALPLIDFCYTVPPARDAQRGAVARGVLMLTRRAGAAVRRVDRG